MRRGPLLVDGAMAQLGRHGAAQHQLLLKARHQRVRVHHCATHVGVWVGGRVGAGAEAACGRRTELLRVLHAATEERCELRLLRARRLHPVAQRRARSRQAALRLGECLARVRVRVTGSGSGAGPGSRLGCAHLERAVDLRLGRSELVQSPDRDQPVHLGAPGEGAPVRAFSVGQLGQAVEAGGEAALAAL